MENCSIIHYSKIVKSLAKIIWPNEFTKDQSFIPKVLERHMMMINIVETYQYFKVLPQILVSLFFWETDLNKLWFASLLLNCCFFCGFSAKYKLC